jgi:hypothetical protein
LTNIISRNLGSNNRLGSLQAIVFSGEADKESMEVLKQVVEKALPEHKWAIRDSHPSNYVGAIGAAYLSKWQMDEPWKFYPPGDPRPARRAYDEL